MRLFQIFYLIQSLMKFLPFKFLAKIRPVIYRPFFKKIGKGVEIHENVLIKFPDNISIGENTKIAQGCIFVGGSGLKIGDNVMIGASTKIITSTHNFSSVEVPMIQQGLSFRPITIESNVWFGFNCVILGGSWIKTGSIVGANSVVPGKEFESNSIIAGNPAKLIKRRV